MKLIFVCTMQNKVFESEDFAILENRGVIRDKTGNRILDTKVALNEPCPFCGKKHMYHASELICPLTGNNKVETQKGEN